MKNILSDCICAVLVFVPLMIESDYEASPKEYLDGEGIINGKIIEASGKCIYITPVSWKIMSENSHYA